MLNLLVDNKIRDGIQRFISDPKQLMLAYDDEKKDVVPLEINNNNIIFKKKNDGKLIIITDVAVKKFPLSILYIYTNCYCDHLEAIDSSEYEFSISDELTSIIIYKNRDVWKVIDLSKFDMDERMEQGILDMKKKISTINPEFNTDELPARYITNGFEPTFS